MPRGLSPLTLFNSLEDLISRFWFSYFSVTQPSHCACFLSEVFIFSDFFLPFFNVSPSTSFSLPHCKIYDPLFFFPPLPVPKMFPPPSNLTNEDKMIPVRHTFLGHPGQKRFRRCPVLYEFSLFFPIDPRPFPTPPLPLIPPLGTPEALPSHCLTFPILVMFPSIFFIASPHSPLYADPLLMTAPCPEIPLRRRLTLRKNSFFSPPHFSLYSPCRFTSSNLL